MKTKKICFGCMKEKTLPQSKCTRCGFDEKKYEKTRSGKELPPGTVLHDRYIVGRVISQGGFGITYLGLDQRNEHLISIKEYFPASMAARDTKHGRTDGKALNVCAEQRKEQQYEDTVDVIFQEAQVRAGITGLSGIAGGCDCFRENHTVYIVMDYIEGETLDTEIRKIMNYQSEEEEKKIMEPMIASLCSFHKAGIIHREIQPQNIIVQKDRSLVLIDFEAERRAYLRSDRSMMEYLTSGFTAPEQYLEHGVTGAWTDVYSLCAVIYFMLTGKVPEDAVLRTAADRRKTEEGLRKNLQAEGISGTFTEILVKGMSVDPKERYQTMDDLYLAIYGKKKGDNEEKNKEKNKEKEKKHGREKKKRFWFLTGLFLTIVFFLVLYNNVQAEMLLQIM